MPAEAQGGSRRDHAGVDELFERFDEAGEEEGLHEQSIETHGRSEDEAKERRHAGKNSFQSDLSVFIHTDHLPTFLGHLLSLLHGQIFLRERGIPARVFHAQSFKLTTISLFSERNVINSHSWTNRYEPRVNYAGTILISIIAVCHQHTSNKDLYNRSDGRITILDCQ